MNKRVTFSGIWNWIVDKLANAVISRLETTSKNVIGAINELNSKIKQLTFSIDYNESVSLIYPENNNFSTLLAVRGSLGAATALLYLTGYGVGESSRYRYAFLYGDETLFDIEISGTSFILKASSGYNTEWSCSLISLMGSLPTIQ